MVDAQQWFAKFDAVKSMFTEGAIKDGMFGLTNE
jgi:hypothetical protein